MDDDDSHINDEKPGPSRLRASSDKGLDEVEDVDGDQPTTSKQADEQLIYYAFETSENLKKEFPNISFDPEALVRTAGVVKAVMNNLENELSTIAKFAKHHQIGEDDIEFMFRKNPDFLSEVEAFAAAKGNIIDSDDEQEKEINVEARQVLKLQSERHSINQNPAIPTTSLKSSQIKREKFVNEDDVNLLSKRKVPITHPENSTPSKVSKPNENFTVSQALTMIHSPPTNPNKISVRDIKPTPPRINIPTSHVVVNPLLPKPRIIHPSPQRYVSHPPRGAWMPAVKLPSTSTTSSYHRPILRPNVPSKSPINPIIIRPNLNPRFPFTRGGASQRVRFPPPQITKGYDSFDEEENEDDDVIVLATQELPSKSSPIISRIKDNNPQTLLSRKPQATIPTKYSVKSTGIQNATIKPPITKQQPFLDCSNNLQQIAPSKKLQDSFDLEDDDAFFC